MKDVQAIVQINNLSTHPSVSATTEYAVIDLKNFNACAIQIDYDLPVGAGSLTPLIEISKDNSTWVTIPVAEIQPAPVDITTAGGAGRQKFNVMSEYRYVRPTLTLSGSLDADVSVVVVNSEPYIAPVA